MADQAVNTYAIDGKCHNAEPGTYGHECGKPATWLGTKADGFQSGFCDDCKARGYEARRFVTWQPLAYVVARYWLPHSEPQDYLISFDDRWGTACAGRPRALVMTLENAKKARDLAARLVPTLLCGSPIEWRVLPA